MTTSFSNVLCALLTTLKGCWFVRQLEISGNAEFDANNLCCLMPFTLRSNYTNDDFWAAPAAAKMNSVNDDPSTILLLFYTSFHVGSD